MKNRSTIYGFVAHSTACTLLFLCIVLPHILPETEIHMLIRYILSYMKAFVSFLSIIIVLLTLVLFICIQKS